MAKSKTSSEDFARFLEDSDEPAAFARHDVSQAKSEKDNKVATNRQQSDNKTVTEPTTKWQQTDNMIDTTVHGNFKSGNKVDTELTTLSATNRQQSGNKPTTKTSFSSLVGLQRALVIFLYESCKVSRSRSTDSLTLEHISTSLKTRSGSVKTTLQRLEAKGCVHRVEFKNGRSGWSKYQLPESIYAELLQTETSNKLTTKWQQTDNKVGTEPATELATSLFSSSTNNLNINTNTTGSEILGIPENLHRFGISLINLQNLVSSGKATKEIVERSLAALSFDVDQGKTGNLANIFFGVLRSGKEYVSQKQAEQLSKELEFELNRIKEIEDTHQKLTEVRLKTRYKEFLEKEPDYLTEVKKRHGGLLNENSDLLEKVAFEEFKQVES